MDKSFPKLSSKLLPIVLLLSLISCGQAEQVAAPDEVNAPDAVPTESPVAADTSSADSQPDNSEPDDSQPDNSEPKNPAVAPAASTAPADTETSRPSPVALTKQDCGQLTAQQDMNQCAAQNFGISDNTLNQVYQEVIKDLDQAAKTRLTTAEERWIVFRDAHCDFERNRYEGGSIAPFVQATCKEQITDNRIAELRQTVKAETSLAVADAQLNEVYQAIQALADEAQSEALTDVQLTWLDYRDAHCAYEANLSSAPDTNTCLAAITETRVWQLQTLQDEWSL